MNDWVWNSLLDFIYIYLQLHSFLPSPHHTDPSCLQLLLKCCSRFHIGLPASIFGPNNLFSLQGDPFKVEAKSYSIFSELLDSLLT